MIARGCGSEFRNPKSKDEGDDEDENDSESAILDLNSDL